MILNTQIPKEFYKLFRTRNREAYMLFLTEIYEENSKVYAAYGLSIEEGAAILAEVIQKMQIPWQEEAEEETEIEAEQTGTEQIGMEQTGNRKEAASVVTDAAPLAVLKRLIRWGWLKSEYDERLNTDILSFPEYSRLYVELFIKLGNKDESRERESILSVYSALFTYHSDNEKNNDILKNAFYTSQNLGQLLSNMQDGMRAYFDELSSRKNFIGIQEVLVEEINNSDSKKYAILTTTDSFYRYKEAIKELISDISNESEEQKFAWQRKKQKLEKDAAAWLQCEQKIQHCEEALGLVYRIEREFDLIERRYNRLIEQKAIFAERALARIHYLFQEGGGREDAILKWISIYNQHSDKEQMLEELGSTMKLTSPFKIVNDSSFYQRRESSEAVFAPKPLAVQTEEMKQQMTDFVPKPLYSKKQLEEFKQKNSKNGVFTADKDTVHSVEDLEKLLFVWQEAAEKTSAEETIFIGSDLNSKEGFSFSQVVIHDR